MIYLYSPLKMYINREISWNIEKYLKRHKIIILYWARQVGKTSLVKHIMEWKNYLYINWDEFDIQQKFKNPNSIKIRNILWSDKYIVIDEAQRITDIWIVLKIIYDNFPDKFIIATWSSSFELANKINEPLTGRKIEFNLYPLSISELKKIYSNIDIVRMLDQWMISWLYPNIVLNYDETELRNMINSYVYKDILSFNGIKKSDEIIKLLQSLALQIGNEVSYNELWIQCWLSSKTVEQYINILEQAFIVFRLPTYTKNPRTGIKKLKKIYFWDLWIRNIIINNLNPLYIRDDTWALRENFVISEIIKNNNNKWIFYNYYFWRDGNKELDLITEKNWELKWYEIKYKKHEMKHFSYIKDLLWLSSLSIVNKDNILQYI